VSDSGQLPNWEHAFIGSVGSVCRLWNSIHTVAHNIVLLLHNYDVRAHPEREVSTSTLATALYNMELREIAATIKTAAVALQIPTALTDKLTQLLNVIDNDLRVQRNRYVHDQWVDEGDIAIRFQPGTRVTMLQARQPIHEFGRVKYYRTVEEIWGFVEQLEDAHERLDALQAELWDLCYQRSSGQK
jgi:hypothetical protein